LGQPDGNEHGMDAMLIQAYGKEFTGTAEDVIPRLWDSLRQRKAFVDTFLTDLDQSNRVILFTREMSPENLVKIGQASYAYAICSSEDHRDRWTLEWVANLDEDGEVSIAYPQR